MNEGAPVRPSVRERYDLDHRTKVATGQEVRERVDQEYRERFGPFGAYVAHLLSPGKVDDLLDAQAAQLRGQVMTRSAPPQPGVDYLGIPHQKLHEGVHVGGDPGVVGEHGDLWTQLGNELVEFNDAIVKAIGDSEPDWTGKAGDQARQAMAGLAQKAGETAVAAQMAGTLFAQQSRALSTARANVPPPPAQPFDVDAANRRLMTTTDPVALVMQAAADRAEFLRQQEEHRQAADAVEKYDRTVAQTAAAQPAFAPPPAAPPAPTPPEGRPTPVPASQVPGERAAVPETGDTTDTASVTPAIGGTTGGGTTNASATGSPTSMPGGASGPGITATSGLGGVPGSGRTGSDDGTRSGRDAGSGPGAGSGRGAVPGGGAGFGAGAGSSRRPTGGLPGSELRGGPGSAVRGPAGTGGGTHGEAVGRAGGRQPGAGQGVAGGPVGGPAAGREEEDSEHRSPSYLLEPDPEALFGNGEATAPPVIGDWTEG